MGKRRGFTLLEVATAGILLVVMLMICLAFFQAMATQRRAIHHHRVAVQEANNVMERICSRPWEELTPENVSALSLDEQTEQLLPGSKLTVEISQSEDEPAGKRITVVIQWPTGPELPDRSVRLVAWRYRQSED
jgi:Tfp pilus assembly protein PilV